MKAKHESPMTGRVLEVSLPEWWLKDSETGEIDRSVTGLTDGIKTYCASSVPCYYVIVPEMDYEGYFAVSDLTVIRKVA